MRAIKTVCARDCYDTCFMEVLTDDNGKPERVVGDYSNPITQGFLCPRGVADIKRTFSQERILYPYSRSGDKPRGEFQRVSWKKALDILTLKMKSVLSELGPSSILHLDYSGNNGLLTIHLPQRLFYALGLTQTDYSVCSKSGHNALSLHYGLSYGVDPDELPNMKLVVYWGFNAAVSAPHLYAFSSKIREKGGLIVAVDARQSETAKVSDFWIQPKPGSDTALVYGVMKHLVDNNLVDYGFIQDHTYGFDALKYELSKWSIDTIEQYTGLKWSSIVKLSEFYLNLRPSATMIGLGMQKSRYGAESVRATSLIPALIGLHRGFYYTNNKGWGIDTSYLTGESLTSKQVQVVSQVALGRLLKQGKFKLIYIYSMNPAETLPNQQAVLEGLRRNDVFVVVHDTHWTETVRQADLALPASTFLEKDDVVVSYSHRHVRRSNRILEPLGESKSELWIMSQLTERLNLKEEWLHEDAWKAVESALENAFENGTPSDLKNGKALKLKMRPRNEYQTPTGKIEFYGTRAKELGVSPLPTQHPLPQDGEFILLNTAIREYTHTQFQDVYGPLPSILLINPEDAETHNISDDDNVDLFNESGSIRLKAAISTSVPKGVLWSPRECKDVNGKPQNSITSDETQKLGEGSTFNTTLVRIKRNRSFPNK